MSFWNSLQQMVSDAGDSARKLVGRGEEQGEAELENGDSPENSRSTNPPRPGCPLVVPEPTKNNTNNKGPEGAQNSFFSRPFGTPNFLRRIASSDTTSSQVDLDPPSTYRTGSLKPNVLRGFNNRDLKDGVDAGSIDSSNMSTDRFGIRNVTSSNDGRPSTRVIEDFPSRRKGNTVQGKRACNSSSDMSRPACFMEMPQRWAELTETRSG